MYRSGLKKKSRLKYTCGVYISFVDNDLDHNNILYIYIYVHFVYIATNI